MLSTIWDKLEVWNKIHSDSFIIRKAIQRGKYLEERVKLLEITAEKANFIIEVYNEDQDQS